MTEEAIINILVLNAGNYHKYGLADFERKFASFMELLRVRKGFQTIEQACDYYIERIEADEES